MNILALILSWAVATGTSAGGPEIWAMTPDPQPVHYTRIDVAPTAPAVECAHIQIEWVANPYINDRGSPHAISADIPASFDADEFNWTIVGNYFWSGWGYPDVTADYPWEGIASFRLADHQAGETSTVDICRPVSQ